jgi:hypothetical protein
LIARVRSGDYDDAVVRTAFMKIVFSKHQEIVSIARNDTAFLACSLIEHFLIFRSGETKLSDVDSVDTPGSQDRSNLFT